MRHCLEISEPFARYLPHLLYTAGGGRSDCLEISEPFARYLPHERSEKI